MNTIRNLAEVVSDNTGMDAANVEAIIAAHQRQFPGSWQDWTVGGKSAWLEKIVNRAIKERDTAPERVVSRCMFE